MIHYENNLQLIMDNDKYINKTFSSNNYGDFIVLGVNKLYRNKIYKPYYICKFINTNYECLALDTAIDKGNLKDNYCKSVFGVGYLGDYDGNKHKDLLYKTWVLMLGRCYNTKYTDYRENCFVCDRWHNFYFFKEDCKSLLGYDDMTRNSQVKYSLDKDFIKQNNNIYCKEFCCFMPQDINSFILNTEKRRSFKFEGVYLRKDNMKYRASIRYEGKTKHILQSDNPLIAHEAYCDKKLEIAKELLSTKYNFINQNIKEIIYNRVEIKHADSYKEIQKAIKNGYFNNLEVLR